MAIGAIWAGVASTRWSFILQREREKELIFRGKQIAKGIEEHVWPLIAAGRIKPVIDSTFPLDQAAAAHARMETSQHIGKIVLTV